MAPNPKTVPATRARVGGALATGGGQRDCTVTAQEEARPNKLRANKNDGQKKKMVNKNHGQTNNKWSTKITAKQETWTHAREGPT